VIGTLVNLIVILIVCGLLLYLVNLLPLPPPFPMIIQVVVVLICILVVVSFLPWGGGWRITS
jgi:hypothetical protein